MVRELNPAERMVLNILGDAWNLFARLPSVHPSDSGEFAQAIHAAQNIIFARPNVEIEQQNKDGVQTIGSKLTGWRSSSIASKEVSP